LVAHRIGKINESGNSSHILTWTILAAAAGLLFNVIFDPVVGYFYKLLILGKPAADLALVYNVASTSINAVTSGIVSVLIYMPLRNALVRSGLFSRIS